MTDKTLAAQETPNSPAAMRLLPSVDALLKTASAQLFAAQIGAKSAARAAREVIEELRAKLCENPNLKENLNRRDLLASAEDRLSRKLNEETSRKFQPVVNATGVIIHTNLGRAPLAEKAKQAAAEAAGYCTLEYDLKTGKRGRRGLQVEDLLCQLTGAQAALVVNNCAAATVLVLSALCAAGGEAIVSRGELVEIGGDFRIPDVMAQSGAKLVEVGSTNRTRLSDFAGAVSENTKLLMRVHPSNYRIVGFTAMPDLPELAALAREKNLLLYEDAGSGALVDLSRFGLGDEPVISKSIEADVDVVTFSADKLLGGCQAGIIVGKAAAIEKLRAHPLYRALRVDKIAYAALAATLEIYRRERHFEEIPVLQMLAASRETIEKRAKALLGGLGEPEARAFRFEIVSGESAVGGGSAPLTRLPTALIAVNCPALSAEKLEAALRGASPPVVARVENDRVVLDLRTVFEREEGLIKNALKQISIKIETGSSEQKNN